MYGVSISIRVSLQTRKKGQKMYKFDYEILERQISKVYYLYGYKGGAWSVNDYFIVIKYFISEYEKKTGRTHKRLSNENLDNIMCALPYAENNYNCGNKPGYIDYSPGDYISMIDRYFKTKYKKGCDYSIYHFMSDGVRAIKYYECLY